MARVVKKKKSAAKKAAPAKKTITKKRTAAKKDGPKRPLSAYMYFSKAKRPALVKAHPEWAFGAFGQELGRMWAATGAAARKPYEALAEKDKKRYEKEMGRA